MNNTHQTIDIIISAISEGKFVAVSDHADREDEADLIISARHITTEQMAFLIRHTSGIITVPMTAERLEELDIPMLISDNPANFDTPFAMPVDLNEKTRGGVSAAERVETVHALEDAKTKPEDFGRPGHVFPLRVHPDGLAGREGHTEASIDLMKRAGEPLVAVIGELMHDDGTMMRGEKLHAFLAEHSIPFISIDELKALPVV